ncbi:hypothetical protein [Undibacterium umbellatum]|uniref:Uncharacterized protein n=1 Tax=Undibacterium umbellatum TaxID=2762300 RepID=A0ABR6ZGJ2_9BURK|nr:hypothetical protein [Undibacterium umbellatum]MBC3910837.1 hypothetical protein [Undibacterium umbellatum]
MWIELGRTSFFNGKLKCVSDSFDVSSYEFIWKEQRLDIRKGDQFIMSTDARSYFRFGTTEYKFKKKYFFIQTGFYSSQDTYEFGWERSENERGKVVTWVIRHVGHPDEIYELVDSPQKSASSTRMQTAPGCIAFNPEMLLACVGLMWVTAEISRG